MNATINNSICGIFSKYSKCQAQRTSNLPIQRSLFYMTGPCTRNDLCPFAFISSRNLSFVFVVGVGGSTSLSTPVVFCLFIPCRVGLVVSVSASHAEGREFASRPGHTKDHQKNGTNCLPAWHAMRKGWSLTVKPDCLKGRVVCGTVYGDMHLKDLLGSIARVRYCILVPDFNLVLHGLCCRKKNTLMN